MSPNRYGMCVEISEVGIVNFERLSEYKEIYQYVCKYELNVFRMKKMNVRRLSVCLTTGPNNAARL